MSLMRHTCDVESIATPGAEAADDAGAHEGALLGPRRGVSLHCRYDEGTDLCHLGRNGRQQSV